MEDKDDVYYKKDMHVKNTTKGIKSNWEVLLL